MSKIVDKFPNYITGSLTLSAANTFTTEQLSLPIPRIGIGRSSTKATIIECLNCLIVPSGTDLAAVTDHVTFALSVGAAPTAMPGIADPETVCFHRQEVAGDITAGGGLFMVQKPMVMNMQDAQGFGTLIAADKINVCGSTAGQAAAVTFNYRIHYRLVQVTMTEYVGLVSSLAQ
jgi:hypothetical protein